MREAPTGELVAGAQTQEHTLLAHTPDNGMSHIINRVQNCVCMREREGEFELSIGLTWLAHLKISLEYGRFNISYTIYPI